MQHRCYLNYFKWIMVNCISLWITILNDLWEMANSINTKVLAAYLYSKPIFNFFKNFWEQCQCMACWIGGDIILKEAVMLFSSDRRILRVRMLESLHQCPYVGEMIHLQMMEIEDSIKLHFFLLLCEFLFSVCLLFKRWSYNSTNTSGVEGYNGWTPSFSNIYSI